MTQIVIQVVNPNSTDTMTAEIERTARAAAGPGVCVEAVGATNAPAAIESAVDEALAAPEVVRLVAEGAATGAAGHVVACFGDPGLAAAREVATGPVVGIAEAAMRSATYLGSRFSVVTTASSAVPGIRDLAVRYGVERACGGVLASGVGVLELVDDPYAFDRVLSSARAALEADASDVLVLGCAGMAEWAGPLRTMLGVPVVDGVTAAIGVVTGLARAQSLACVVDR